MDCAGIKRPQAGRAHRAGPELGRVKASATELGKNAWRGRSPGPGRAQERASRRASCSGPSSSRSSGSGGSGKSGGKGVRTGRREEGLQWPALGRQGTLRARTPLGGREAPSAGPGPRPPRLPGPPAQRPGDVGEGGPGRRGAARGLCSLRPSAAPRRRPQPVGLGSRGGPGVGGHEPRLLGEAAGRRAAAAPALDGAWRGPGSCSPCRGHHVARRLQHLEHAGLGQAGGEVGAGRARGAEPDSARR